MFSISVERIIDKPIADVFQVLSEHANYAQFKGVEKSSLIKNGHSEINGLGAVREIQAGGATLHEEIVAFERPYLLGYKIIYSKPLPYLHELYQLVVICDLIVLWHSKSFYSLETRYSTIYFSAF
jgi:uncharacterized protein YndB with AHSA1/START domain